MDEDSFGSADPNAREDPLTPTGTSPDADNGRGSRSRSPRRIMLPVFADEQGPCVSRPVAPAVFDMTVEDDDVKFLAEWRENDVDMWKLDFHLDVVDHYHLADTLHSREPC